MDVFSIISEWYKWLLALPGLGFAVWIWKHRRITKEHVLFWWGLKKRIEKLEKPVSKDAKFCPNCDYRLSLVDCRRQDIWWYKCGTCSHAMAYPAPTAIK